MKAVFGIAIGLAMAATVQAQGRVDTSSGQLVEKPAPSRFYGTARPPGAPGGPPVQAPAAPPSRFSPPGATQPVPGAAVVPPVVVHPRPPVARPYHPAPVYVPPRTHVDITVGTHWHRPWYGPRPIYPGWGWPHPYPPAVVVPPPVIVQPAPPPVVYIERPAPIEDAAPVAGFWYWCGEPEGWYPQVVECPQGWLPVPPRADR